MVSRHISTKTAAERLQFWVDSVASEDSLQGRGNDEYFDINVRTSQLWNLHHAVRDHLEEHEQLRRKLELSKIDERDAIEGEFDAVAALERLRIEMERTQLNLRDAWVRDLYTEEGTRLWIADMEKRGHGIEQQLHRLAQLLDGTFM